MAVATGDLATCLLSPKPTDMTSPPVHIATLGCKVNQCDADEMGHALAGRGYRMVGSGEPAEVYIVNTCTVTATADAKARKLIRRLARRSPDATIVVTGCLAQRDPDGVAALPEVDAVIPNTRKREMADILADFRSPDEAATSPPSPGRARAFLKIQDGCDHRCAYCIIPYVRGRPSSRPKIEVLQEVRRLTDDGIREIVLCGIRLGAFGRDRGDASLAQLLRSLREVPVSRLRLSSIEPMDLSDDLLHEIADHPTLCPHLHLPLQSGDNDVLAAMGRGYTGADFAALVERVRRAWPDAALTTDVMVGFPGETEQQFDHSCNFAREVGFTRLHVFPYSSRPGTAAVDRPDQVPPPVKRRRAQRMLALGRDLAAAAARQWIGREVEVLFEERDRAGLLTGLTPHYHRVHARGADEWIGCIVQVAPAREESGDLYTDPQDEHTDVRHL